MPERKPILVRIEYDDGTYRQLRGEDVEAWWEAMESVCIVSHFHNANPFASLKLLWEEGKIEEEYHD